MTRPELVVIHPSDEMYGADKVLLEVLSEAPASLVTEVWLPTDVDYPKRELSRALVARGISVRRTRLPILRRAYLRVTALPRLLGRLLSTTARLVSARPRMLYVNTAAGALLLPVGRMLGARVVLHLHEHLDGRNRILLPFLRFAHRIVAVSNSVLAPLPDAVRARTVVVRNGFDLPDPAPLPPADGVLTVLVASRWNSWKGYDLLLDAWGRLQRTDLRLVVLGGPPPIGDAVDVPALVAAAPNRSTIEVVGQTDHVRDYIDAAHVVAVPSTRPDPLPTIAIEALAAGRMLLCSDIGGLPEIAGDGVLVTACDVDAWVAALEGLDAEAVTRSAALSRARFDEGFSRARFDREIDGVLWDGLR